MFSSYQSKASFLHSIAILSVLLLSIHLNVFALSGEFVSDSGAVDKIEIAGASAIVTNGGISKSYLCSEKDGYITLTQQIGISKPLEIITLKILNNGQSILCKSGNCIDQVFNKIKESNENIQYPLTGFCPEIKPLKPKISYSFSGKDGLKIHLTKSCISKLGDGDPEAAGVAISQILIQMASREASAGKEMKIYREVCFDFDDVQWALFIKDEASLQRLTSADNLETRWNIMQTYASPWGKTMLAGVKDVFAEITNHKGMSTALMFYELRYNDYVYSKCFEKAHDIPKLRSNVIFNKDLFKNYQQSLDALSKIGLLFVVCDDNWNPVCWIDYYKDYVWGNGCIQQFSNSDSAQNKIYNILINGINTKE
jgi:hypothetical protein